MTRISASVVLVVGLTCMAVSAPAAPREEKFGGLGLEVAQLYAQESQDHLGPIVVLGVLPGTPAEAAGLEKGDIITQVDGEATAGKTFEYLVLNRLRGKADSLAKLTVRRGGKGTEEKVVEVKRVEMKAKDEAEKQHD